MSKMVFRQRLMQLQRDIEKELPTSREKSLTLTKLDEARLWLNECKEQ